MTAPVAGLTTSKLWPSAAPTDSPPMIIRASMGLGSVDLGVGCDSVVMVRR
jgi:hypothetical protein